MKKWEIVVLSILIAGLIWAVRTDRQQRELADKLIRLHVVANSDSDEDQRIKLSVRDAVLTEISPALSGAETREQAEAVLRDNMDAIARAAEDELARQGSDKNVTVTLTDELFPTRRYETFSLPAGEYASLRVTIGEGGGHNWWCVVFPPLCDSSAEKTAEAAFSPEEMEFITSEDGGTVIKFKTLEIIAQIKEWFALHGEK